MIFYEHELAKCDCGSQPREESRRRGPALFYWIECPVCGNCTEESIVHNEPYKWWQEAMSEKKRWGDRAAAEST